MSQPTNPGPLDLDKTVQEIRGYFDESSLPLPPYAELNAMLNEILGLREEVTRLKAAPPDERIDRFLHTLVAVKTECGNARVGAGRVQFDKGVKWFAGIIQQVIHENNIPEGGNKGATP